MPTYSFLPSKIPFTDIGTLERPGNPLVTYVLFTAQGNSTGQEFIWNDSANDFVPVGDTAYNVIGTWNASTNTPAYTTTLTTNGDALSVSVAGTTDVNGFDRWNVGDLLVRDNDIFFRVPNQPDIVSALTDNSIPVWNNNQLEDSSIAEDINSVDIAKNTEVPQGSIMIGPGTTLSEFGGLTQIESNVTNNKYLTVLYQTEGGTISPIPNNRPFYFVFDPNQDVVVQSDDTTTISNVTQFDITSLNFIHRMHTMTLDFNSAVTNFRARVTNLANSKIIKYFPSKAVWDSGTGGVSISSGKQEVYPLSQENATPIILPASTNFRIEISADGNIDLQGDSSDNPYVSVNVCEATITEIGTGSTFIPSDHSVTEFNDVTDAGSGQIITSTERIKLSGIAENAEVNVQADFSVTDQNNDAFIQNKDEGVQDIVGAMVTGNTETGIQVTYDDTTGKLNFVVTGGSTPPQALHTNYLDVTSDNQASSVNTGTAESSDDLNPTFTIPTFTENSYLQILQSMAHTQFTSISIGGLNQVGTFTINDNAITLSGQAYRQYVTTNMVTSVLSGDTVILGGAS